MKQTITLEIEYDPDFESPPETWDWNALLDTSDNSYIKIVKVEDGTD
jgi:hypothetical protein